jgi:hypothetical protein
MNNPDVFQKFTLILYQRYTTSFLWYIPLSTLIDWALFDLTQKERRELQDFLYRILNLNYSDDKLMAIWDNGQAQLYFLPIRQFLTLCHRRTEKWNTLISWFFRKDIT